MAIPKYGGRDCELSTTGVDGAGRSIDSWEVTQQILAQMGPALADFGCPSWTRPVGMWGGTVTSRQFGYGGMAASSDCLRQWTGGGQCYYSDMGHVEVCTASCLRPSEFAAQCVSTLLAAEAARRRAEQYSPTGDTYCLSASNADLLDPAISFGTHLSMQVSESLWENLMVDPRYPATLGFVTSGLAAIVPFFGGGYLLPLKDGSMIYSLSARAHHLKHIKTYSTTQPFGRGLLNSRRESHTTAYERLHLICFDFDILGSALLFSLLQCLLAAAEETFGGLMLVDPLRALKRWSWQIDVTRPQLANTAVLVDGTRITLPGYIRRLASLMLEMVESGLISAQVAPEADVMLPRIVELAERAERQEWLACARHLGWASKLLWLSELARGEGWAWHEPALRVADHDFSNTDPQRGALWRLWQAGAVDPLCDLEQARTCLRDGPADSRDWARGKIIGRFPESVEAVDWGYVSLRTNNERWSPRLRIELPQLDSLCQTKFQSILDTAVSPLDLHRQLTGCVGAALRETDGVDDMSERLAVVPRERQAGLESEN